MEVRLNRFIAQSGFCSRRKADRFIEEGKVKVNGKVVKEFWFKVDPGKDTVEVEGKIIKPAEKKIYIKLYKPKGYLTQLGKDRFGRKTLTDLFKEVKIKQSVFPAGRLDFDSEGLLVLTNDGDFANMLMHPKKQIRKTYIVEVEGRVRHETFNLVRKGKKVQGDFLKPDDIKIVKIKKSSTVIQITIHSGQKRIIRRYMSSFGHPVRRLIRIKIGGIHIDNLKAGEWDFIPEEELKKTIQLAGKR